MSIASQDVYLNLTTPISVIGTGGGSVNSVVGGANISTTGTTSVSVALQDSLTGISSIAFNTGAALTNVSTINGAPVGVASLPANPGFSSIVINVNNVSTLANISSAVVNADESISYSITADGETSQLLLKGKGNDPTYAALTSGAAGAPLSNVSYITVGPDAAGIQADFVVMTGSSNVDIDSSAMSIFGSNSVHIRGPTQISSLTVSSIAGAAYPPAFPVNATFSTLSLSTIGAIANSASSTIQTFNTVIGNMRIQGGSVVGATGGTTVNWATAFTTVPIVLASVEGTIGASVVATVQGASENSANFSISAGGTGEIIDYIAIGAA